MKKLLLKSRKQKHKARLCAGFQLASPQGLGRRGKPFQELWAATKKEVHELKCLAGAAHLVLHKGKCVFACSQGWSDLRRRNGFNLNTICRLHGCTKPLVAVAFLTLVDNGEVRLTDHVSKYIPFPDRVAIPSTSKTKPASTPATLRNLLTMTAGLGYDEFGPYKPIMDNVKRGRVRTLAELCGSLCKAPLMADPGVRYGYSFATDMLGYVCEVVSGKRLDKFVKDSLLKPVGMKDTYFVAPAHKLQRVAKLYKSRLKKRAKGAPFSLRRWSSGQKSPTELMSAGGGILSYEDAGMLSTVRDYAHFCQMILNGGKAPNGRRILKASTVKSLWEDGLAAYSGKDGRLRGWNDCEGRRFRHIWDRQGLSILHTHIDLDRAPDASKKPRKGSSMWMAGGGGTGWAIDAKRELVSISFTQCFSGRAEEDGMGPPGDDAMPYAVQFVDGINAIAG
jgi:CubicO group peptidase (beta-lactamase class C family)